jgi:hypothetical protein
MELESWGVRGEIVEHRVVLHWHVRMTDGRCCDGLASPGRYSQDLVAAMGVAGTTANVERFYDALIMTGRFSLAEIDDLCGPLLRPLGVIVDAPVLVDD